MDLLDGDWSMPQIINSKWITASEWFTVGWSHERAFVYVERKVVKLFMSSSYYAVFKRVWNEKGVSGRALLRCLPVMSLVYDWDANEHLSVLITFFRTVRRFMRRQPVEMNINDLRNKILYRWTSRLELALNGSWCFSKRHGETNSGNIQKNTTAVFPERSLMNGSWT